MTDGNIKTTKAFDETRNAAASANPSYGNLQASNEQIVAVNLEARSLLEQSVGAQESWIQALKQVAADYSGLGASADEISKSAKLLAIQQNERARK